MLPVASTQPSPFTGTGAYMRANGGSFAAGAVATPSFNFGDVGGGFYRTGANQVGLTLNSSLRWTYSFGLMTGSNAAGPQLSNSSPAAAPNFTPNKTAANAGIGAAAAGNTTLFASNGTGGAAVAAVNILFDRTTATVPIGTLVTVVGSLPAGMAAGARAFVTDSTLGTTAGIGLVVVGGGANGVAVFYDGAAWRIG